MYFIFVIYFIIVVVVIIIIIIIVVVVVVVVVVDVTIQFKKRANTSEKGKLLPIEKITDCIFQSIENYQHIAKSSMKRKSIPLNT